MAKYDAVKDQVAAIFRRHLEEKFGDRITFDEIHVTPQLDEWDEEYLQVKVVIDGDTELFDRNVEWIGGLHRRMRPELLELGVTTVPADSYIDKSEIESWTEDERVALFR